MVEVEEKTKNEAEFLIFFDFSSVSHEHPEGSAVCSLSRFVRTAEKREGRQ